MNLGVCVIYQSFCRLLPLVCAALVCSLAISTASAEEPTVRKNSGRFDGTVARLLARRCLDCHNSSDRKGKLDLTSQRAALAGGESGLAISPGKPGDSLLYQRVEDDEMPPDDPLPAAEKRMLFDWIAAGARWGSDPIDRFRFSTDKRAGFDWWSLQPVSRPPLPDVKQTAWAKNPIDRFVLARLEAAGLRPSAEAERRTLARRSTFDLWGLPPSPEEVEALVADTSPDAYEQLVDRLLASPRYGERWARHWLDIVRFGESQGFERDKLREHAWPYRDWVADARNRDLSYHEFVRQQIAGDVLYPGSAEAVTATGFLVAGAYDEVGQNQQSAAMRAVVRQDELEDLISVVGQTFLGLTVNCARCHDHKFDPVRQREYYQLSAALAGVRHGERELNAAEIKTQQAERASRIKMLAQKIAAIDEPVRRNILAERKPIVASDSDLPSPIAAWDFARGHSELVSGGEAALLGGAAVRAGQLRLDGQQSYLAGKPITRDISEKTLVAVVSLANLKQRGGGVVSLQTLDGTTFDAIVFGEREPGQWMAGSDNFRRTQSFQGPQETSAADQPVHVAVVYGADGTITGCRNGQPYGKPYKSNGPVRFAAGKAQILIGLRHGSATGNRLLAGSVSHVQVYDRALSAEQIAQLAKAKINIVSEKDIASRLTPERLAARTALQNEIAAARAERTVLKPMRIYAVAPRTPEATHVLLRGNPTTPGELVQAGGVVSLGRETADFGLSAGASDAQRRMRLADWITHRDNPLFARVIVNRLWHYHFGVGLVDTPSDFGFNGGRPTHPQLLDWLAAELIHHDWRIKPIERLMLTSATYRQASRFRASAARVDANNRLLWRKSPARLEAEAIRDAVLSVAGELNLELGGPGYRDFETFTSNTQFYVPRDPVGPEFQRRSLYRTWVRSGRNPLLDAFDCPDPSTKTPQRTVTTTPLQALALLNNSFILRMSDRFAARLKREASTAPEAQIALAYQLAYGRNIEPAELPSLRVFVQTHGLAAFCRVILNSNEFLYVE